MRDQWSRWAVLVVLALLVVAFVAFQNWPRWELASVSEIRGERGSRMLTVAVDHNDCGTEPRVRIRKQSRNEVVLRAEKAKGGDCDDIGLTTELVVELDDPIGERRIELESVRPGAVRCDIAGTDQLPCD